MRFRSIGLLVALLLACGASAAAQTQRGFLERTYKDPTGIEASYVLFVPHDYTPEKSWPLMLFLHGRGESITAETLRRKVGIGPAIARQETTFPFLVLCPQSLDMTWQADTDDATRAIEILGEVQKQYSVDPKRLYLSGLSMGGNGTWIVAAKHPEKWAAIVPMAAGVSYRRQAPKIAHIACWVFHGGEEKNVPVPRAMVEALRAAGGSPKYDEYPRVGHNCWDRAYGSPELYTWLLEQRMK